MPAPQLGDTIGSILRRVTYVTMDLVARLLLAPMRWRHRRPASAAPTPTADVAELNRAADEYFRRTTDRAHLLDKPFSEPDALSRRLIDLGVLLDAMRLRPGDTVLELGAGSCWVSHLLNRFGCRTISVDVSQAALDVGRLLFEREPRTNWALDPQFLCYDGHRLPAPDASVDAIVLYDVFHHLPNPPELLREMRRVVRTGGVVAMSEPGRGHADSLPSRTESLTSGVLESELVIEDLAAQADAAGFESTRCVVATDHPLLEINASELRAFMAGRGFSRYWAELCAALDSHYYVLLVAGDPIPTTARPGHLKAIVAADGPVDRRMRRGESCPLRLRVRNVGDTTWLFREGSGWTRVGAHLYGAGSAEGLIDYDWCRWSLPGDVAPGESVQLNVTLPPIDEPGRYLVVLDLVVEGTAWFGERESRPLYIDCTVL